MGIALLSFLEPYASAKVDMTGCQLLYYTEVDAIGIRMDAIDDVLIFNGGAAPAQIANVVTQVLRERGYLKDDGTDVVDMEQILGKTTANQ